MPSLTDVVRACFERVLQQDRIREDESFFDLGGDSLLALSLLLEIKNATGRELSLAALYDAASVKALAQLIVRERLPTFNPLVTFRTGITPAIFMVHGIFANVVELLELSKLMPTPRAIYGLQPRGLDGNDPPFEQVEAMAEYYLEAITQAQPRGPYVLVGYSFGGLVALEIALRLQARSEEVGTLCLIDTYTGPRHWPLAGRMGIWRRRMLRSVVRMARMRPTDTLSHIQEFFSGRRGLRGAASAQYESGVPLPAALQRVRKAGFRAFMAHDPKRYDDPVIFFRASSPHQFPADPVAVWRPFLGNLTVHELAGDHYSMIKEHADSLASLLCVITERSSTEHPEITQ